MVIYPFGMRVQVMDLMKTSSLSEYVCVPAAVSVCVCVHARVHTYGYVHMHMILFPCLQFRAIACLP